ncbi:MAG: lptF [Deltaproteobacteria bacterium]|nr:lptF [Deltaproteobacteria bacterium]
MTSFRRLHKKLYVYLLGELSSLFFLALFVFTFILVVSRLGRIADLVINKGVELSDILLLVLYSFPAYLTFTFPMAFLLSTIVVLGRLSGENEILALKANGIDLRYLLVPFGALGLAISLIGILNTTVLVSAAGDRFRDRLVDIAKKSISVEDKEGVFNDSIPRVVIYIGKVDKENHTLSGILISDDRDEGVKQTISAARGIANLDPTTLDLSFSLHNGSVHRWEKKDDVYRTLGFKDYLFSMNLMNVLPHNRELRRKNHEMSLQELATRHQSATGRAKYEFLLEMYKKFTIPFAATAFIFVGVPLGITRRAEGKFSGVVYSLFIFIAYYVLVALTENIGRQYRISPPLVAGVPNILVAAVGLYLLRHLNTEEQVRVSQGWKPLFRRFVEKAK